MFYFFFFSSRRRHTRLQGDWSSDVCSSDLDGIAREDPTTVVPGPNGVVMQPAPKRATDGSHQAFRAGLSGQIRGAPAGQWQVVCGREFASPSLDLNDQIRGEKSGDDPDESVPLSRRGVC